jgi:hypothetical protein
VDVNTFSAGRNKRRPRTISRKIELCASRSCAGRRRLTLADPLGNARRIGLVSGTSREVAYREPNTPSQSSCCECLSSRHYRDAKMAQLARRVRLQSAHGCWRLGEVRKSHRRCPSVEDGRVGMWRGCFRPNISVAASFVWRCLSGSTVTPFPHPAHRTRTCRSPASGSRTRLHAFTHGTSCPSAVRRTSPKCP